MPFPTKPPKHGDDTLAHFVHFVHFVHLTLRPQQTDRGPRSAWVRSRGLVVALCGALGVSGCETVPILLYHHIGHESTQSGWVSEDRFREQMLFLRDEGYTPITASELDRIELDGYPAPPRPIVITIDDGFQDFYIHAFPVLESFGFTATMFLVHDRLGDDEHTRVREPAPFLTVPEVLHMQQAGIEFQSHGMTHARLRDLGDQAARRELEVSKQALAQRIGVPMTVFAYPEGVHSLRVRDLAKDAGYRSALSVNAGLNGRFDRLRFSVHQGTSMEALKSAIEGTWWAETRRP